MTLGSESAMLLSRSTLIIGTVAYFLGVAAIAIWAARRTKTAADFFVAGRRLGIVTMTLAAMAATLSGFTFIGGPGLVYSLGLGAIFINLPLALTTTMVVGGLAARLQTLPNREALVTVPDIIDARFASPLARGLSAAAILIATVGYVATNFLAMGLAVDTFFGSGLAWGIVFGALVTVAYSVSGGILAGVYTDVFQGLVMAGASATVFGYVLKVGSGIGGIGATLLASAPQHLAPYGTMAPLAALSFYFVFGIGSLGQPHVVHKFLMLKRPEQLRWYPLGMAVAMSVTLLLFVSVGLVMRALVASGQLPPLARPDLATTTFLARYTPPAVVALVFAGVLAAIMSTVNSFLNVGAAALVRDLPRALGHAPTDELTRGRWATLAIALVALAVALKSSAAVAFMGIFGYGLFASTLVPALVIGLNWERATRAAAVASISVGLVVTLALESLAYLKVFTFPAGVTPTAVALVLSMLTMFGVSFLQRLFTARRLKQ